MYLDIEPRRAETKVPLSHRPAELVAEKPPAAPAEVRFDLSAGRNSVLAFQAMVYAREKPVRKLRVTAEAPAVIHRVHYVDCPYSGLAWPDVLTPFEACDVAAGTLQPVFVELPIAGDCPPGPHELAISFEADGHDRTMLRVRYQVSKFALPAVPTIETAVGVQTSYYLDPWLGGATAASRERMLNQLCDVLIEHRLSPYPWDETSGGNVPWELTRRLLADPRVTSVRMPYPADDAMLAQHAQHAREMGALGKCYWYEVDEPDRPEQYEAIRRVAARLRRVGPDYRLVVPFWCRQKDSGASPIPAMSGACNVWCAISTYAGGADAEIAGQLEERVAAGDRKWGYVCNGPQPPYANVLIDQPGLDHRLVFWQLYLWGCEGFLYWCANRWPREDGRLKPAVRRRQSPSEEKMVGRAHPTKLRMKAQAVWHEIVGATANGTYGDGVLLYPALRAGEPPLPSLRLKIMRRGIDDYSVLKAYEAGFGRERAVAKAREVAPSLTVLERLADRVDTLVRQMREELSTL